MEVVIDHYELYILKQHLYISRLTHGRRTCGRRTKKEVVQLHQTDLVERLDLENSPGRYRYI